MYRIRWNSTKYPTEGYIFFSLIYFIEHSKNELVPFSQGEDDIRQDAVMQQVFGIVNKLLANDNHTQKSRLKIRTYKVSI